MPNRTPGSSPRSPRHRSAAGSRRALVAFAVAGLLTACGSSGGGSGAEPPTAAEGDRSAAAPDREAAAAAAGGPSQALRSAAAAPDGLLAVRVEGRRLFVTVTAGAAPLVALADLSTARLEVDDGRWRVALSRPDRGRADGSPASWQALVAQPGGSVEVGPYELAPGAPSSGEVCLEVLAPAGTQADAPTGTAVRLGDRDAPTSELCRSVDR